MKLYSTESHIGVYLTVCNFLINEGGATAAQIEELGETVRAKVKVQSGVDLEWEIKRIGLAGAA